LFGYLLSALKLSLLIIRYLLLVLLFSGAQACLSQKQSFFVFEGKNEFALSGEWNLVMDAFLSYDEVRKDTSSIKAPVPGTWNKLTWNGAEIGPYGYGTFYTRVIPKGLKGDSRLAIEVSEVSLSYNLYVNGELIGNTGTPGKNISEEKPKINHQIFSFKAAPNDTLTIVFHVSNFRHESGGIWYEPKVGMESGLRRKDDFNKGLVILIIGAFAIAALFQLYVFLRRREEKFGLYFFLGSAALVLLSASRGSMVLLDFFPETSWVTVKKILYISLFTLGPLHALFLRELFPKFMNRRIVQMMTTVAIIASLFTLFSPPRISYSLVPIYHGYNVVIGTYMFIVLIRAAYAKKFGAGFLLIGYGAAFLSAVHDILSTQYVIPAYSIAMIHIGTIIYITQLIFVISGRYIYALDKTQKLSDHLQKVNQELEQKVKERTKDLRKQNKLTEKKNKELQKTIAEKDHLMAVVAHDLKAPLSSIMGISDLMKKELTGKTAKFNEVIRKVTVSGRKLIEDLTEIRVYEQAGFETNKEAINLSSLIDQKKIEFGELSKRKDIQFSVDFKKNPNTFRSDESILNRIIDNLLSNAIKFSKPEGKVFLSLEQKESKISISIKDTGPGFTDRDKSKVFEKFQRLSARPTAGESSTGLGLSIVKTLVELLAGKIVLESEEGKGAEFIVEIPSQ